MAYLDTKVKHDNAKVCGVSLRVAREWIREKIANKQEQPEVDLEKAYKSYIESRKDDLSGNAVTVNMKDLACHFYELGCTRTAEMYDDIEYNRQRAEEAELSGDLDEEVKRYWNEHALEYRIGRVADIDFLLLAARHFYELGLNARKEEK